MTRVKICGITSVEDARAAASAGADAIGMIVDINISPRCLTVEQASRIAALLPPLVTPVIVMMPASAAEVVEAVSKIRPGAVQLHGNEPPEMVRMIKSHIPGVRVIKTVHVGAGDATGGSNPCPEQAKVRQYEGVADAILLDTATPATGGAGIAHDWNVSRDLIRSTMLPVLLAGGLKPENVAEAIKIAQPYGVDVASGVEAEKRKKDIRLVREFIRQAKGIA